MTNHPNRGALPRPAIMLREIAKRYPDAWQMYDQFRQDRGKNGLPDWPEWCYCPMAAAYAVVSNGGNLDGDLTSIIPVQALSALAAWRVSQGIYRFDSTIAPAIVTSQVTALPVEVLYRLPEWCVYIEATPGLRYDNTPLSGFFAYLEWDANEGLAELRFLLDCEDWDTVGVALHLDQPTLDQALEASISEGKRQAVRLGLTHFAGTMPADLAEQLFSSILPLLNLVLYLCTVNADFGGNERPSMPNPVRTKRGWKLFPPDRPRVWEVGSRVGAALRAAHLDRQTEQQAEPSASGRQSPRPHVRRAHWHTYRTGEGRAGSVLKWMPPIPINIDLGDVVPTIKEVRP